MSVDITWTCTYCGAKNRDSFYLSSDPPHICRGCGKHSVKQAKLHLKLVADHFASGEVDQFTGNVVHWKYCMCGTELVNQTCPFCIWVAKEEL